MKTVSLLAILFLATAAAAQKQFRLNNASKTVDVGLEVGTCSIGDHGRCEPLTVTFFRKNALKPFQTMRLPETSMWAPEPKANVIRRYDDQSVINFSDYNFDGSEDVAICDGTNGGYGMPSYRVYLYNAGTKRFVHSPAFTRLGQGPSLGMFETDKPKKIHFVYSKSGCCWHQTEGYDVHRNRPRKIYELTEDATSAQGEYVRITTKKLINGKWRTWVRSEKVDEYYK